MLSSLRTAGIAGSCLLLLGGCAEDVVLKPAVITFNSNAHAAVDAARQQYAATIVRLNNQTADFLAVHPECGLKTAIYPAAWNADAMKFSPTGKLVRSGKPIKTQIAVAPDPPPYCLTPEQIQAASNVQNLRKQKLLLVSEQTFAPQYEALQLLLDYVTFLAKYSDDPKLTSQTEIKSTADSVKNLGDGINGIVAAAGGNPIPGFGDAGLVSELGQAVSALAGPLETIVDNASDVSKLKQAIKDSEEPVNRAIDRLATNADQWRCAEIEQLAGSADDYATLWNSKFSGLDYETRQSVARHWINMTVNRPAYCPHLGPNPVASAPASADGSPLENRFADKKNTSVNRSDVAMMLLAVKQANSELIQLAHGNHTDAQRKAIIEVTLSRLGDVLVRLAPLAALF
jgi:hypothetical protein